MAFPVWFPFARSQPGNPVTWVVCDLSPGCGHHGPRSEPTSGRNSASRALGRSWSPLPPSTRASAPRAGGDLDRGCHGVGVAALPSLPLLLLEAGGGFAPGPLQPQAPASLAPASSSTLGASSGLSSLSLTLLPLLVNLRNPDNPGDFNFVASAKSLCPMGEHRPLWGLLLSLSHSPIKMSAARRGICHSWSECLGLLLAPGAPYTSFHLTPPARGPSCPGTFARPFLLPSMLLPRHPRPCSAFSQPGTQVRPPQ